MPQQAKNQYVCNNFVAKQVIMAMMLLAAGLCSFEVVTAAEAGLGLSDLQAIAKARIEGTLERKAAIGKRIIDKVLHRGKATSTLNAATATPTPTIPTTGVVLVVVSFATRITTFTVANFTAILQQQYVDAIYQSTPDVLQVVINSIIPGSVIVSTSAVLPQNQSPWPPGTPHCLNRPFHSPQQPRPHKPHPGHSPQVPHAPQSSRRPPSPGGPQSSPHHEPSHDYPAPQPLTHSVLR
ncbi:g2930 [Coccomyxa elongata]